MASSLVLASNSSAPAPKAKLILQAPHMGDAAQAPALQLSRELSTGNESGLDPKTLQKTWEVMQLKPEDVISQSNQLHDADVKADTALKQTALARVELVQVQTKLRLLEETRWQHPIVYAASAAILGLGCLWFFERKNRIAAQEHAELLMFESHSVLDRPEGPPSDLFALDDPAFSKAQNIVVPGLESSEELNGRQHFFTDIPPSAPVNPVFEVAPPWWSRKRRVSSAAQPTPQPGIQPLSASPDAHIKIRLYEDSTEIESIQTTVENLQSSAINSQQLKPTAAPPISSKDAMAYLLEIRMTVQTFYALEQPHSAHQLLGQHINAVPNTCAWAYMEYLDISSKLGLRDAFEAMRTRYRLQFNRLAPYWMEPNASVQFLDSYERPMSELCAAWPSLNGSKVLIANWLLGNLHSRRLFHLPAYHDLLDLYEMLEFYDRDLIEAQDFVPTVSLLELDYEFAVEVKLDAESANDALRAIPTVKPGDFAVDFNLAHNTTQQGALEPINPPL